MRVRRGNDKTTIKGKTTHRIVCVVIKCGPCGQHGEKAHSVATEARRSHIFHVGASRSPPVVCNRHWILVVVVCLQNVPLSSLEGRIYIAVVRTHNTQVLLVTVCKRSKPTSVAFILHTECTLLRSRATFVFTRGCKCGSQANPVNSSYIRWLISTVSKQNPPTAPSPARTPPTVK